MVGTVTSGDTTAERPIRWIHDARTDILLAFAWVPFAAGAMVVPQAHLRWYALGVLLLSLLHQPVTLALVYTDGPRFSARRRLFLLAPVVLAAVVFVGLQISFVLVAIVGGLWNTEHTLMQRYGFTRIYRRKGGDSASGERDLHLLAAWLILVLAWAVADSRTPERIESLGLGDANQRSLELLVDVRPVASWLLVLAGIAAAIATTRWLRHEWGQGFAANPAAYIYLGATGLLFSLAVLHPVAALLAWVGSHAVEYFVIVAVSLDGRRGEPAESSLLARLIGGRLGVVGFMIASSLIGSAIVLASQVGAHLLVYGMVFFCIGGLHIFYDGVIWKLRKPAVARSLAIET